MNEQNNGQLNGINRWMTKWMQPIVSNYRIYMLINIQTRCI